MEEFLKIFKEHEDELEISCPEFTTRIHELVDKDVVAGNRVGSRYSKEFSEDISLRCGDVKKKKKHSSSFLNDEIKERLNAKLAEEREVSKMVASLENQILSNDNEETVNIDLQECKVEPAKVHFIPMCDECGERHLQEHRECNVCMEVHEGCCEL